MKLLRLAWLALLLIPQVMLAAPSLQVAPLQYEEKTDPASISRGFVDVSNPTDSRITIISSVKAFRQTNDQGDLEFYDDGDISAGIKVGLDRFELGPREAVRVMFDVDGRKLPQGGNYAAVFFRTESADKSNDASFVTQSANVGTLLMLTNGDGRPHRGQISGLTLPFWQLGGGISGRLSYRNTDTSPGAVAFRPALSTKVWPWGRPQRQVTGLVMPGNTRAFALSRPGSFIGPVPVAISDADTGRYSSRWVFACTGYWRWLAPLLLLLLALVFVFGRRHVNRLHQGFHGIPVLLRQAITRARQAAPQARQAAPRARQALASAWGFHHYRAVSRKLIKLIRSGWRKLLRRKPPAKRPVDGLLRPSPPPRPPD